MLMHVDPAPLPAEIGNRAMNVLRIETTQLEQLNITHSPDYDTVETAGQRK